MQSDDFFAHDEVLSSVAKAFSDPTIPVFMVTCTISHQLMKQNPFTGEILRPATQGRQYGTKRRLL